ncbi:OmpW/AlkL family protein [Ancylobacter polymorphus]|uniref:OmpW/AlkL family protein n=1 Tax=Ancylobacter polymorphus TaxID=223390 RepID=UPI003267528A
MTMSSTAQAQDASKEGWFVRTGPLGVLFDSKADISVGGGVIPGASADTKDNLTLGFDVGYRFDNNVSLMLTGGIPPKTTLTGTGPLGGVTLGKTYYAPAVLAAQYHFTNFGPRFQPYVGAGVNYTLFFGTSDGAVADLKVNNAFAPVLQAGFEYDIDSKWGVYMDVKKIFLSTTATGTVGGNPARAEVTANPTLLSAGIVYRF